MGDKIDSKEGLDVPDGNVECDSLTNKFPKELGLCEKEES